VAYDPADIHLPPHLLRMLDYVEAVRIPIAPGWHIGVTRSGAIFSSALFGVWAAALYSGNNLLYLCGAMLLALALVAVIQTTQLLNAAPLFGCLLPDWCQSQTPLYVRQVTLSTHTFCHGCVTVHWLHLPESATWRCDQDQQQLIAHWLPQQRHAVSLHQQTLTTNAPLGLWTLSRCRYDPGQWVVMPPICPMPDSVSLALQSGESMPAAQPVVPIAGDEFHALRHYSHGDSPTRIHWRKAGSNSRDWRSKVFVVNHDRFVSPHLVVDLRLPATSTLEQFELLLGQAWGWLRDAPSGASLTLGNESFSLPFQRQHAIIALAKASPSMAAPLTVRDGVLLSLRW